MEEKVATSTHGIPQTLSLGGIALTGWALVQGPEGLPWEFVLSSGSSRNFFCIFLSSALGLGQRGLVTLRTEQGRHV